MHCFHCPYGEMSKTENYKRLAGLPVGCVLSLVYMSTYAINAYADDLRMIFGVDQKQGW